MRQNVVQNLLFPSGFAVQVHLYTVFFLVGADFVTPFAVFRAFWKRKRSWVPCVGSPEPVVALPAGSVLALRTKLLGLHDNRGACHAADGQHGQRLVEHRLSWA